MKLNFTVLKKGIQKDKLNFVTVDGITCSGKTLFSNILNRELKKKIKNTVILSKDIFLLPRKKRIFITKNLKNKKIYDQNKIHYDLLKLKKLFKFLIFNNKKKLILDNLYNRKTGKNNLKKIFYRMPKGLIIFEGIYVNQDIKKFIKPTIKILISENIYTSLFRKIDRIRDKKISIQNVVTEFTKIHLESYKKYLQNNSFDYVYRDLKKNFVFFENGKKKQLNDIKIFLSKHIYSK